MSEGTMTRDGNETWYRVVGDLDSGPTPVVICHGGPGAAHDYTEPIANLSRYGRGCVLYDQVGCGNSTHLPDAPADFWTVQLFKDELVDLTRQLGHRRPVRGGRASRGAACSGWSMRSTIPPACAGSWSRTRPPRSRSGSRRRTACAPTCRRTCRRR